MIDTRVISGTEAGGDAALLSYIRSHARATPEHDPRWLNVLADALGHHPSMIVATRSDPTGEQIAGCLPLALVSSHLFGRFLVSLPYLNRAGVLADGPEAADALLQRAAELADQHDVRYLELRHEDPLRHDLLDRQRDEKVRMVLDLPDSAEALWKQLDSKVRNQIRKGEKSGLTIHWGRLDQLDAFYGVFAENMRDLGTPVYSRRLFASILEQFAGVAELAVARLGDLPIAGALLVHDPLRPAGCTQVPSASSLRTHQSTNANMWMYHHLLLRTIERGGRQFDFGRSSVDSGTYRFKKQWGARPTPTVWQYHLRRGDIDAVRPDHPRYQRRIETWKRLPVWLTRLVGPAIVRCIP